MSKLPKLIIGKPGVKLISEKQFIIPIKINYFDKCICIYFFLVSRVEILLVFYPYARLKHRFIG